MDLSETRLPGIGIRYDFKTREGRQVGVIVHNTGHREIVTYDRGDSDSVRETIGLNDEEADTLAEVLGAARFTGPLEDLKTQIYGLTIDWLRLGGNSPYINRPMGDIQARSRTGVSIVAVVRNDDPVPSPKPDFVLDRYDVIIAIGTPDGVAQLRSILAGNE